MKVNSSALKNKDKALSCHVGHSSHKRPPAAQPQKKSFIHIRNERRKRPTRVQRQNNGVQVQPAKKTALPLTRDSAFGPEWPYYPHTGEVCGTSFLTDKGGRTGGIRK
jgi:hypothetical protein